MQTDDFFCSSLFPRAARLLPSFASKVCMVLHLPGGVYLGRGARVAMRKVELKRNGLILGEFSLCALCFGLAGLRKINVLIFVTNCIHLVEYMSSRNAIKNILKIISAIVRDGVSIQIIFGRIRNIYSKYAPMEMVHIFNKVTMKLDDLYPLAINYVLDLYVIHTGIIS